MPTAPDCARVFAVVLAAGAATRFGRTKQIADYRDEPLVRRAAQVASSACNDQVVLVLGHDWRAVYKACRPFYGGLVLNTDYARGISTSIATGVGAIRHAADAVLIVLADQPLITVEHLRALQSAWSGRDMEIVASAYADTVGVPALFSAGCFDHLCSLDGDRGAQSLLNDSRFSLQTVEFADAAVDIDTPGNLLSPANSARN
jgi:molybdenum cofactor cytidylyltransferase